MNTTDKLIEMFKQFPGIGPRQAKRFVYFLLTRQNGYAAEMSRLIADIRSHVTLCQSCFRFFTLNSDMVGVGRPVNTGIAKNGSTSDICPICRDERRDKTSLMIVSHDVDFENIEKTSSYAGYYFILGGTVPILEKKPEERIRQAELLTRVKERAAAGLSEVIMALSYNPEGENTLSYLRSILSPVAEQYGFKISTLGRGLSTGTELEYSDPDTIKNALKNRQ